MVNILSHPTFDTLDVFIAFVCGLPLCLVFGPVLFVANCRRI